MRNEQNKTDMTNEELLTPEQVGRIVHRDRDTVTRWARQKMIKSIRLTPKTILISRKDLNDFILRGA